MAQSRHPEKPILLIDDEESWLVSIETLLARHGKINNIVPCKDSSKVMGLLAEQEFSLVLLDYEMPGISGDELLPQIVLLYPQLPVIVLTGHNQVDTAVYCKDLGAANYLVKTQGNEILAHSILGSLKKTVDSPSDETQLIHPELFTGIIAKSPGMKTACQKLDAAIDKLEPLLLVGENGVGKTFLVRRTMTQRTDNNLELDAESNKDLSLTDEFWVDKLLATASKNHIYLKNVDALDKESQQCLLKLLQQKLDVRFILTLSDLDVASDKLRDDLLRLLKTHMIQIPPLRERKEDLPELTHYFIQQAAGEGGKKKPTPPLELDLLLQSYFFPGNVAELKTMVFSAIHSHRSKKLSMDRFKQLMVPNPKDRSSQLLFSDALPNIEEATSMLIDEAEKRAEGNQSIMADMLGISRQALNRRLNRKAK